MNQILPYSLWIGHAGDGVAFRQLVDAGIGTIVQLAYEETPIQPPRDMTLIRIPLVDGEGNEPHLLQLAIDVVHSLLFMKVPTLVCCQAGISRSPAIAGAALSRHLGCEFDQALKTISEHRRAWIAPMLLAEVRMALSAPSCHATPLHRPGVASDRSDESRDQRGL